MSKITMLKGLPASGKTTYAKSISTHGRVNKDDIRAMLGPSCPENIVISVRNSIISALLKHNMDIIVDDTNLNPIHEKEIKERFGHLAEIDMLYFDSPLEECLSRNANRDKRIPDDFIISQHKKYVANKEWKKPIEQVSFDKAVPDKSLPKAIIVDIDGTIAKNTHRDIYDLTKVSLDEVIQPTKTLVDSLQGSHKIIFLSGRYDSCKDATAEWLDRHGIRYEKLLMRRSGDTRKDNVIKHEFYKKMIEPFYNVEFVIDDRKSIKRMWHKVGLFVFDVNQTDEWF